MAILSYEALQRRFESKPDLRDFLDTAYYWRTRPEPNKRVVSGKMQIDRPNTALQVAGATNFPGPAGTKGSAGSAGTPGAGGTSVTNITIGDAVAAISLPLNEVAFGGGEGQSLRSNPLFTTVPDGDKLHVQIQNDILLGGDIRTGYNGFTIRQAGTDTVIFGADIVNIRRSLQIGADPSEDAGGEGYDVVIWGDTFLKNSSLLPELPLFKAADGLLYSRRLEEVELPYTKGSSVAVGTILVGDPVAATGVSATELAINTALAATLARSWMIGVSNVDGTYPGETGGFIRRGPVTFDTSAFTGAVGATLWLQPGGGLNTTVPTINNATRKVNAGTLLVKDPDAGKIYVDPVNFPFISELSGVSAASPADKNSLMFNTSTNRWEARAIVAADVTGVEPTIAAGTTAQYWRGDKTWQTLNTAVVPELTNLYYTDARARAAISASAPLAYNSGTGALTHLSGDGQLHVPATSTTNNGKFLQAGATAGAISWVAITPGSLGAEPAIAAGTSAQVWLGTKTWGQVADAQVASGAAIAWSKISKSGAVPGDVGAAPAFTSAAAGLFWSTPAAASGVPSLRAIVASDVPILNQKTTGSAA